MLRRSCRADGGPQSPIRQGHQYLVRVGVSGAQQPLVLVKQHPELTVKLRLVEQLAQHGAAGSHLPTLGLTEMRQEKNASEQAQAKMTDPKRKKGAAMCEQYLMEGVGEDVLIQLPVVRQDISASQGFDL